MIQEYAQENYKAQKPKTPQVIFLSQIVVPNARCPNALSPTTQVLIRLLAEIKHAPAPCFALIQTQK
jgi:hypothetical protein